MFQKDNILETNANVDNQFNKKKLSYFACEYLILDKEINVMLIDVMLKQTIGKVCVNRWY